MLNENCGSIQLENNHITIATEAKCVEELWLDDDDQMTANDLLAELLAHLKKGAMRQRSQAIINVPDDELLIHPNNDWGRWLLGDHRTR